MRVLIGTNCCTNCVWRGDSYTDGTFSCVAKDEYLEEEQEDCEEFELGQRRDEDV